MSERCEQCDNYGGPGVCRVGAISWARKPECPMFIPLEIETDELTGITTDDLTEMGITELQTVLGLTVKRDDTNKTIHFLGMLLAYTEESQINISNRGPSASGKSYIPIELATLYFPPKDVQMIAYSSPTSFFHEVGGWDSVNKRIIIDLEKKILIFQDQPHDLLLQRLRPLLSHDTKELLYKITDKREKKGMRTKNVVIKGFPSVFFCTGSLKIDEQEATRSIILSPETTREKIRESIILKAMRKGDPHTFRKMLDDSEERKLLRNRVLLVKRAGIKHIIFNDAKEIVARFIETCPLLKPRHSRDIERVMSLAQGFALLNFWRRKRNNGDIYVNETDIENAFAVYGEIAQCQELGIPPYTHLLYKEVFVPLYDSLKYIPPEGREDVICPGMSKKRIMQKFYDLYQRPLSLGTLDKDILPSLITAGLISEETDPEDRRRRLYHIVSPNSDNPPTPIGNIVCNSSKVTKLDDFEGGSGA